VDGVMRDLGTLGGDTSYGYAINNSAEVAGVGYLSDGSSHAFRYDGTPGAGGVMHDLGTLGGTQSGAFAINNRGQVGGYSSLSDGTARAMLYVGTPGADGHMINLDAWLDSVNPTDGANWILGEVDGMSDNGWITGNGSYKGSPARAFLLDASTLVVPEPNTHVAFACMTFFIVLCRRSSRAGCAFH
jgi:probable HAF family extracellular repeat protein